MTEKSAKSQKQIKKEEFDIKEIYTPLSVAKKEIWKRWNDKELKKKVEDFLGGDVPGPLKKEPRAMITRQLASPDLEFVRFLKLAQLTKLKPLAWEFLDDMFITTNRDKADLARMAFFHSLNKKLDSVMTYKKVIDLTGTQEKKKFKNIKTLWGENFVNFHHRLLKEIIGKIDLFDASRWYHRKGKCAKEYYPYFLALFIRNGVMFENFLLNKEENGFTRRIVLPSFKKLEKLFGVKPLIVPIADQESANDSYWWCYPQQVEKVILN